MKTVLAFCFISLLMISQASSIGIKSPPNIEGLAEIVYTNGWAILIGINDYEPSEFKRKYANSDVDAIKNLLMSRYGFNKENIMTLKNEKATKQNIVTNIEFLSDAKSISMEDCLLIYFYGQAKTLQTEKGEFGFLVPYNTKIDLSKDESYEFYKENCISIYELQYLLRFVRARHIFIIADACLDGIKIKKLKSYGSLIPDYITRVSASKGFQVLTAGGKSERPIDDDNSQHGFFTKNLIKCLKDDSADENKDRLITSSELSSYMKKIISELTNEKQKPSFMQTGDGEFLFVPQPDIK